MREFFGLLALIALLLVAFKTEIPAKSVRAVEAWLDAQAIEARSGKTGTGLIAEGDESAVTK
jgi:hypothetical protein